MEIVLFVEKVFFTAALLVLLVVAGALIVRVNNSVKMTKLELPSTVQIAILLEITFIALCIFIVLLTGHL